jgi:hypothetical protein
VKVGPDQAVGDTFEGRFRAGGVDRAALKFHGRTVALQGTPTARVILCRRGTEARQVMQDKRAIMQLALPGKLLFLFRLRFGLYAVLSRIEAEADWAGLESKWAEKRWRDGRD